MILTRKKAQLTLKILIELVIGILIFVSFFFIAKTFGTGEIYEKMRLSSDSASSIDTLAVIPENSFFLFSVNQKYSVSLQDSSVKISASGNDLSEATRYFVKSSDLIKTQYLSNPNSFIISKSGDTISLEQDSPYFVQRCPSVSFKKPQNLMLSPKTKSDQLYDFTEQLSAFIENSEARDVKDIPINSEAVLEIKETNSNNFIVYFAPNLESRKLACILSNSLLSQNNKLTFTLIPAALDLKDAKIAVSMEIPKSLDKQSAINSISSAYKSIT